MALDASLEQGKLLLIELKNKGVETGILLQVLRYASWVSQNPDSVRLLLEKNGIQVWVGHNRAGGGRSARGQRTDSWMGFWGVRARAG